MLTLGFANPGDEFVVRAPFSFSNPADSLDIAQAAHWKTWFFGSHQISPEKLTMDLGTITAAIAYQEDILDPVMTVIGRITIFCQLFFSGCGLKSN